ncbi:MAG: putative glycolipid-binding domain-containing protein [Actinomycetota bacterium]
MRHRTLLWRRADLTGIEGSFVEVDETTLSAHGGVIASGTVPHQLTYRLETSAGFTTRRIVVRAEGAGWRRDLDLRRDDDGAWTIDGRSGGGDLPPAGGDAGSLKGCPDCDLGYSPLTNTMPVLRHRLHLEEGSTEVDAAWISVPDLQVERLEQRYSHVRRTDESAVVRYETRSGSFTADIEVDRAGFVVRYPGLATRID